MESKNIENNHKINLKSEFEHNLHISEQFFEEEITNSLNPSEYPYSQTTILSKYKHSMKSMNLIYPKIDDPDNLAKIKTLKKRIYKCDCGDILILKCIRISAYKERLLNNVLREYFIGKMLGKLSENAVDPIDMKQISENNGAEILVEILYKFEGEDLEIIGPTLKQSEFINLMFQFICTLNLLEKIGIAHLDLKPQNIVYNKCEGKLKLIDFGTSVSFQGYPDFAINEAIGEHATRISGYTKLYAPPEVTQAEIDKKALYSVIPNKIDVYCFATTFIDILFLMHNLGRIEGFLKSNTKENLSEFVSNISKILKSVGEEKWMEIIYQCLAYNPKDRPSFEQILSSFIKIVENYYDFDYKNSFQDKINYKKIADSYYYELDQFGAAIYHYEKYLAIISKDPKPLDKNELLEIYNNCARSYGRAGDDEKANLFLENAIFVLEELQKEHGLGNADKDYYDFGITCHLMKLHEKAHEYFEKCMKIRMKKLGKNNVETAATGYWMGRIYYIRGNVEKAIKYFNSAAKILEKLKRNKTTLIEIYDELAKAYKSIKKYDIAFENLMKSYKIRQKLYKEDNPQFAKSYDLLSVIKHKTGKFEESINLCKKSIDINIKILSEDHPNVAFTISYLGKIYTSLKDYKNAEKCLKKAEVNLIRIYDEKDETLLKTYQRLGKLYYETQQFENSGRYYQLVKKIIKEKLKKIQDKKFNIKLSRIYQALSQICRNLQNLIKAEKYEQKALTLK